MFSDLKDQFAALSNIGNDIRQLSKEAQETIIKESDNLQVIIVKSLHEIKDEAERTRSVLKVCTAVLSIALVVSALIIVLV